MVFSHLARNDFALFCQALRIQPESVTLSSLLSERHCILTKHARTATACLISPFTGSEAAAALAYPLSSRRGDVLISLCGVAETDSLIAPVEGPDYTTSQDWSMVINPATAGLDNRTHELLQWGTGARVLTQPDEDEDDGEDGGGDDDEEEDPAFFAVVQ